MKNRTSEAEFYARGTVQFCPSHTPKNTKATQSGARIKVQIGGDACHVMIAPPIKNTRFTRNGEAFFDKIYVGDRMKKEIFFRKMR